MSYYFSFKFPNRTPTPKEHQHQNNVRPKLTLPLRPRPTAMPYMTVERQHNDRKLPHCGMLLLPIQKRTAVGRIITFAAITFVIIVRADSNRRD
ncbi:MAG: hypothetical protein ACTIKR_02780 [Advenella sp.]|uniref:hypothetical protein n=1 Tax=Advenella sp. TaxID=1872388 RepID=UPI003F9901C3